MAVISGSSGGFSARTPMQRPPDAPAGASGGLRADEWASHSHSPARRSSGGPTQLLISPALESRLPTGDLFVEKFEVKYPKAVTCLEKDREVLLSFYDYQAEHWPHLRTTNPIESTFATVRLRHRRTKGSGSRSACLAMVFKLVQSAEKKWRRLKGYQKIVLMLEGRVFKDGIMQERDAA